MAAQAPPRLGATQAPLLDQPPPVLVFVFDTQRGAREGEEQDKILAFYPAVASAEQQQAAAGLAEALTGLTGIFSPGAPLQSLTATLHRHAFLPCEPGLWFCLVVENEFATHAEVRDSTLVMVLRDVYALFSLLHGGLRNALDRDPSGTTARRLLEPLVADLGGRLAAGKLGDLPAQANALSSREGLPLLPLDRPIFLSAQFVVNALATCCGGQLVQEVLLFHDNYLCWSGLRVADTHALYCYAARCLLPAALAAASSPKRSRMQGSAAPLDGPPFRAGEWRPAPDGFLEFTPADDAAPGSAVHVQLSDGERRSLCVLARDSLTLLLLLPEGVQVDKPLRAQLAATAGELRLPRLSKLLSTTAGSLNRWHVPGYRYLYLDGATLTVRGSPESKLSTLAPESLAALSQLRAHLEALPSDSRLVEHEVCIRTLHDAWVVMRRGRGRVLYIILERAGDTLLEVNEAADRFCQASALMDQE